MGRHGKPRERERIDWLDEAKMWVPLLALMLFAFFIASHLWSLS